MPEHAPPGVEDRSVRYLDASMDPGIQAVLPENFVFDDAGNPRRLTSYHFGRLRRRLKILRWLDRLELSSFIDLASGWDHYPFLIAERYGVQAYYSDMVHRMNLPVDGPRFGKLDHAVTLRLPRLPFRDGAFDVVVCSEVLEHLVRPVEALAELLRVTRKVLIVTSLEALAYSRFWQTVFHHRVDTRVPHVDRNFFLLDDFRTIFGTDLHTENLQHDFTVPVSYFTTRDEQDRVYGAIDGKEALVAALCQAVSQPGHGLGAMGILLVKAQPGCRLDPPRPEDDPALARWVIEKFVWEERYIHEVLEITEIFKKGLAKFPEDAAAALVDRPVAAELRERLRCPDCRGALAPAGTRLHCGTCPQDFDSDQGVPILFPTRPIDDDALAAEALDRLCGADAARRRALTRLMRKLRRNEGPPGALRRALWRLEQPWMAKYDRMK